MWTLRKCTIGSRATIPSPRTRWSRWAGRNQLGQARAVHRLGADKTDPVGLIVGIDGHDHGMLDRRQRIGVTTQPLECRGIRQVWQDLDRDSAIIARVDGAPNFAMGLAETFDETVMR